MRYLFALGALIASPLWAIAQDAPLSPRYTKGLGVSINDPWYVWATNSFRCEAIPGIGDTYSFVTDRRDPPFLAIAGVRQNSPAENAGIRCGDIIDQVDGKPMMTINDLRAALNETDGRQAHRLYLRRPRHIETTTHETIFVDTWEDVVLNVTTHTLDWVAEARLMTPRTTEISFADEFGPAFALKTSATLEETRPGEITYTCSLTYKGGEVALNLASLFLDALGIDGVRAEIPQSEGRIFEHAASVERSGIPKLVAVPITVARPIFDRQTKPYLDKFGGSVGRIETGRENDWYAWHRMNISCFFPEATARKIELKRKQVKRIGSRLLPD